MATSAGAVRHHDTDADDRGDGERCATRGQAAPDGAPPTALLRRRHMQIRDCRYVLRGVMQAGARSLFDVHVRVLSAGSRSVARAREIWLRTVGSVQPSVSAIWESE